MGKKWLTAVWLLLNFGNFFFFQIEPKHPLNKNLWKWIRKLCRAKTCSISCSTCFSDVPQRKRRKVSDLLLYKLLTRKLQEIMLFLAVVFMLFIFNVFNYFWISNFSYLASNYMFKVNKRNTRRWCEIFSKLTVKTP